MDPSQLSGKTAEHAEYRLHRNEVDDPGYRNFLMRLASPLLELVPAGS